MTRNLSAAPSQCPNCGTKGTGYFCADCGAPQDAASTNPYAFLADSFFKLRDIKRYAFFYWRLLSSPTKNTIEVFEAGRLIDGVRFLEYSIGVYLLGLALSGFDELISDNEIVKTLGQSVQIFVTYTVTFTLYYLAMRNKGTHERTSREFILFACLTMGFTLPTNIAALMGTAGELAWFALCVPLIFYLVRTWRYFWGASGKRVFWTLTCCSVVGGVAGALLQWLVWWIFGVPDVMSDTGSMTF